MKKIISIISLLILISCGSKQSGSEQSGSEQSGSEQSGSKSFFTNIDKELQACYESDLKSDKDVLKKQCDEKLAEIKEQFSKVSVPSEQCREASVALMMHCAVQAKFIHTQRSAKEVAPKFQECLFSQTQECKTVKAEFGRLALIGNEVKTCMSSRQADLKEVCSK
jgi:hypothetical protein